VAFDVDHLVHELLLEWPEGRELHASVFFALIAERRDGPPLGERPAWSGHTADGVARELRRLAGAVPPGARGIVLASVWVDPQRLADFLALVRNNVSAHIPGPQADQVRRALRTSLASQRSGARMTGTERNTKWKAHRRLEPVLPPLIEGRSPAGVRPSTPGIPVAAMARASVALYAATPSFFTPGHVASVSAMDDRFFVRPVWRPEGGAMLPERYLVGRTAELVLDDSCSSTD